MSVFSKSDTEQTNGNSFLNKALNSFNLVTYSLKAVVKYPVLLIPILLSWTFYGITIIYFKYYFNWSILPFEGVLTVVFLLLLCFCAVFSIGALILLEFIQQIETDKPISVSNAFYEVFSKDFIKALPIIIVWAIIWFVLTVIEAILRKNRNNDESSYELSYENAAKTLAGYENFSLIGLSFDLIESGIRLIAFLIYPAIAWEDASTINSIKKGFSVLKANVAEFTSGFVLTETAATAIFLPPSLFIYFTSKAHAHWPDIIWVIVIIYIAFGWSLYLYLQQMFAALLYMWNMKWLKEANKAKAEGLPIPKLADVKMPNLLDDIPDLIL